MPKPAAEIAERVQPLLGFRFSGDPVIFPFPDQAPRDLPRVIFPDPDGIWRCEIAPARLNLFWQSSGHHPPLDLSTFVEAAAQVFRSYSGSEQSRVDRLAMVVTRFARSATPAEFLSQHFLAQRWVEGSSLGNVEFNIHSTFRLAERIAANVWMRNSNAFVEEDGTRVNGVLLEQDINTLFSDDPEMNFDGDDIEVFFRSVGSAFDEFLAYYYPEGGSQ